MIGSMLIDLGKRIGDFPYLPFGIKIMDSVYTDHEYPMRNANPNNREK